MTYNCIRKSRKRGEIYGKVLFSEDQLISASEAAKHFADLKKRAAIKPQFILSGGKVEAVMISSVIPLVDKAIDELTIRADDPLKTNLGDYFHPRVKKSDASQFVIFYRLYAASN